MSEVVIGGFFILLYIIIKAIYRRDMTTVKGAPFVALEPDVIRRILKHAEIKKGDVFYDLGSGDGRIVIAAALMGATAYGVEIDIMRVWYSRLWIRLLGLSKKAKIIHRNLFEVDYSKADIVNVYLLQKTNDKLAPKLKKELKKGTRVIGVAFNFPKWKIIKVDPYGPKYGPLYIYKV